MEGFADLRQMGLADLLPGLGRVEGPSRTICIEGFGNAVSAEDFPERAQHRLHRLAGPQLGVQQSIGGIVDDLDERLLACFRQLQPAVKASVQVQHLAETLFALSSPAVAPPRTSLLQ